MHHTSKVLLLVSIALLQACAPGGDDSVADEPGDAELASFTSEGKADRVGGIEDDSYLAYGVLDLVNQATFSELDDDAKLNARAARNIVNRRTSQGFFTTLQELDAVSYVGPSAFDALSVYAQSNGYIGSCGDAKTQPNEACDDGNVVSNDGCSSVCEAEATGGNTNPPVVTGPPYGDQSTVHGILGGTYEALAILKVASTSSLTVLDDEIGLDVRAAKNIFYNRGSGYKSLELLDGVPWVGKTAFRKLLEYAQEKELIASCGDGVVQPTMEKCDDSNLNNQDGCDDTCRLENTCGDGIVEYYETCDDGNTDSNDGCSSTCRIETLYETGGPDIGAYRNLAGKMQSEGDVDKWSFEIDRPSEVFLSFYGNQTGDKCLRFSHWGPHYGRGSSSFDPDTVLLDSTGKRLFTINERCGRPGWDFQQVLLPGKYTIRMTGQDIGNGWDAPYTVDYKIKVRIDDAGPVCGDNVVSEGEQCDDGNSNSNDGCSVACQWESLPEAESNNSQTKANAIGSFDFVTGSISANDKDFFMFKVTEEKQVKISPVNALSTSCPFDGYLELLDVQGNQVAKDDDSAGNYCPEISERLAPGTYFVSLRHAAANTDGGAYTLLIRH